MQNGRKSALLRSQRLDNGNVADRNAGLLVTDHNPPGGGVPLAQNTSQCYVRRLSQVYDYGFTQPMSHFISLLFLSALLIRDIPVDRGKSVPLEKFIGS
ncbi:hypothetical protein D3C71_1907680 [compost metagenome]